MIDGLGTFEETLTSNTEEKRRRRKKKQQERHKDPTFICPNCGKDCHSRIGLSSHGRRCFQRAIPYSDKTDGCIRTVNRSATAYTFCASRDCPRITFIS